MIIVRRGVKGLSLSIITCLNGLRKYGLSDIKGLAFVTDKNYEVFFYAMYEGIVYQSNDIADNNFVDSITMNNFYKNIKDIIVNCEEYNMDKLNVIKFNDYGIVDFSVKNISDSIYNIRKQWKKNEALI